LRVPVNKSEQDKMKRKKDGKCAIAVFCKLIRQKLHVTKKNNLGNEKKRKKDSAYARRIESEYSNP
jgi:hypothetical protein